MVRICKQTFWLGEEGVHHEEPMTNAELRKLMKSRSRFAERWIRWMRSYSWLIGQLSVAALLGHQFLAAGFNPISRRLPDLALVLNIQYCFAAFVVMQVYTHLLMY